MPSGSVKWLWWQTPESTISPENSTPSASSSARRLATSSTRKAIGRRSDLELHADPVGLEHRDREAGRFELAAMRRVPRAGLEAEQVYVEALGPLEVPSPKKDEVDALDHRLHALGRFVAHVRDARALDGAGDTEVARAVELAIEEAVAAAQEDGRDVDLHLVEEAGRQVLLGDVGAA